MPTRLGSILKLEVPVIVQIASRAMAVKEVLSLAPGAIIELPKLAHEDLEIMVNNKAIGAGTAVKLGENFGIRVTYLGDLRQRIAALGGAAETELPAPPPAVPRPQNAAEPLAAARTAEDG